MKRVAIIFTVVLLICAATAAIAGTALGAERKKVLIVSQGSDFKKDVIAQIRKQTEGRGVGITEKSLSYLSKTSEDEWDAIVVVHAIKVGRMKRDVKRFFDGVEDWNKVIVVTTCGSEDPVPEEYGIDSLTAASKQAQVDAASTYAVTRLKAILQVY